MAIAAGGVAFFYLCRLAVFLIEGPDGPVFATYFGSAVTTMVTMVLLVVVSFSMAGAEHRAADAGAADGRHPGRAHRASQPRRLPGGGGRRAGTQQGCQQRTAR